MTTEVERAAEEYASTIQVPWPLANNGVASAVVLQQLKQIQIQGFLAGHSHALTPRKIDPKDESTWPPDGSYVVMWWKDGKATSSYANFTRETWKHMVYDFGYWLEIPPTPQREGEDK